MSVSCPNTLLLRRLIDGDLPADEQGSVVAHLDGCPSCQQRMEALAGGARVSGLVAAAAQAPHQNEASLQRVLADLKTDPELTLVDFLNPRSGWAQSLLQPATSVESLGRFEGYEVSAVIGQGGMGVVLKAYDPALKRWVAIKVLAPHLASDQVARKRFAREAQAAAAVRHENVVAIHHVSETNGLPYLVMEYVPGGSLQDSLRRQGTPPWQMIVRLGMQIASGLAAAHELGLIHRDIKPSNILLQRKSGGQDSGFTKQESGVASPATGANGHQSGEVRLTTEEFCAKITDFGLARAADEAHLTQTGIVAGTPMYMAPEQALGETLDGRCDLFSLGSVLYALCTGTDPFAAGTPMAVLRRVCDTTPKPIREINPEVPVWLVEVIERLHAKKPADRFASAADLAELLRQHLAHLESPTLVPQPASVAVPRVSPSRRRRWIVLGGVLLLAGAFTLSEVAGWTHLTAPLTGWNGDQAHRNLPLKATLQGHSGPVWALAVSPDGQTIATAGDDQLVRLWEANTGQPIAQLAGHKNTVYTVAFAREGNFLASGSDDGTVKLWDTSSHDLIASLPHGSGGVRRIAIAPDGKTIAVAGTEKRIELWDVPTRKMRKELLGHESSVFGIAYAPDGKTLASSDTNGTIKLWDTATNKERASFRGDALGVRMLAFSPDSKTLASAGSGDKSIKLWDVDTGEERRVLAQHTGEVLTAAFSPGGRRLATGGRDGKITFWDVATGQVQAKVPAHSGSIWVVAFTPDGKTLASVGQDRVGKLWDLTPLDK